MPTVREIEQALFRLAPKEGALDWDNVGQLLGDPDREIRRVLVALDITEAVADEAIAQGCQLIVSHHPVMNCKWLPVQSVRQDTPQGHLLLKILKNDLSAICMHTNLDAAEGGVNDTLAALLGLRDTAVFADGCGRIGTVDPTTAAALARLCAEKLGAHVQYVEAARPVVRVAEVSGAGGSYWQEALALGADCLVTGEASHHAACDARRCGLGLVVAGHWGTEHPIAAVLAEKLAAAFPALRVQAAAADTDPFLYL